MLEVSPMTATTTERDRDLALAYLFLRGTLGINLALHGVSRLLAGPGGFAHGLVAEFQKTLLPGWSVLAFGLVLPWVEALIGLLILVGWRTRAALIAGSLLMAVLTFGSCLRQDWQGAGAQLVYAAVLAALLAFRERNVHALDARRFIAD